jgi:MFS family permease
MQDRNSISDEEIQRSLRNSTLAGVVGVFFFMIIQNGPIPLMLEKLGAGGIAIGLTATLFQLGMLIQIPAAFITEGLKSRKPFWAASTIVARALLAIPGLYLLLFPEQSSTIIWITLLAIGMFSFLAQSSSPSWFSWIADLVPEEARSAFWATRQGFVMVACVVSVALSGWFLDLFPSTSVAGFGWLIIFASFMGIMDIVIHWNVVEPTPTPPNKTLSAAKRILSPLRNRDFLYFTLSMCVWFFGLGLFGPFLNVYLKTTFDISYTHLSAIQLAGMLSSVVSSFIGGRLIQRTGLRAFGLAMVVAVPLCSLVWFFLDGHASGLVPILGVVPQPVMVICYNSLVAGGIFAGIGMLQLNLLSALAPSEGRTMAMAVHWSLVGVLSAAGPIAGGWIKDYFTAYPIDLLLYGGTHFSYFHIMVALQGLLTLLVMLPLLLKVSRQESDWPLDQAVVHIFILTPLRSVRNLYNFNLAASSAAVKAAKETGSNALQALRDTTEAKRKQDAEND